MNAWYPLVMLFAATSVIVGVNWDISWHITIGRDSFWSPPHMAIYLGGVLAGLSSGFVVLRTTFAGTDAQRDESVRVWGFRGPLGAWAAIWGAFAMIVSAPFDDWWHNAYGLDVEIISPPHVVLALGITAVVYAAVLLLVSRQNRAPEGDTLFPRLYLYVCGVMVLHLATFFQEYTNPNQMHGGFFYIVSCAVFPLLLAGLSRASRLPWAATKIAAIYMLLDLALDYVFQLVPATPKLAPIYNRVDHLVPSGFPLLLVLPALAIDLSMRRFRGRDTLTAAVIAVAFLGTYLITHWFLAIFLLSPAADNPVFMGGRTLPYFDRPGPWMWQFWDADTDPLSALRLLIALALAFATARFALWRGTWLQRVVR
jgi:hypothetical protein